MAKLDSLPIAIKCYAVAISHLWAFYRVASCKNFAALLSCLVFDHVFAKRCVPMCEGGQCAMGME